MKSAGRLELARMPPTVAAATITASGRCAWIQSSVGCWRRRSTWPRPAVSTSQPSPASRRTMALPTMPRWPATKIRRPARGKRSAAGAAALMLLPHHLEIVHDHLGHQLAETHLVLPAELRPGLRRVPMKIVHFRGTEIARIDGHQHLAALGVDPLLLGSRATPGDLPADLGEGELDELAHRMGLPGRDDVVVGLLLLQHDPHGLDIVARMAPVTLRIEIAQIKPLLIALVDGGHGAADLAGDEGLAPCRAFMIEKDSVRGMHGIGLTVVH